MTNSRLSGNFTNQLETSPYVPDILPNNFALYFCLPVFHNSIICFIILRQHKISDIDTTSFYFSWLYRNYELSGNFQIFWNTSRFLEDFLIVFNLCYFVFRISQKNNLFHHIRHCTMMDIETSSFYFSKLYGNYTSNQDWQPLLKTSRMSSILANTFPDFHGNVSGLQTFQQVFQIFPGAIAFLKLSGL